MKLVISIKHLVPFVFMSEFSSEGARFNWLGHKTDRRQVIIAKLPDVFLYASLTQLLSCAPAERGHATTTTTTAIQTRFMFIPFIFGGNLSFRLAALGRDRRDRACRQRRPGYRLGGSHSGCSSRRKISKLGGL